MIDLSIWSCPCTLNVGRKLSRTIFVALNDVIWKHELYLRMFAKKCFDVILTLIMDWVVDVILEILLFRQHTYLVPHFYIWILYNICISNHLWIYKKFLYNLKMSVWAPLGVELKLFNLANLTLIDLIYFCTKFRHN